jgi:uncharacterized protein YndB with AHSA1/START domain
MNVFRPVPSPSRSAPIRRARRRAATLALCAAVVGSAMPGWVRADAPVALRIDESAGVFQLHGVFATAAAPHLAWQVLTDYEHIPDFVHSLKRCDLELRPDGQRVLNQAACAGSFPFRRTLHVALELNEAVAGRIAFRDILGKDFNVYFGEWQMAADSAGTVVRYTLAVQPRTIVPHRLIRSAMSGGIRSYLSQMQAEMERRAALGPQDALRVARAQPPR